MLTRLGGLSTLVNMKRALILFLLSVLPITASSHPGKTDHAGGHRCLRDCEKWGLLYGEYHEHDKDGKPIRVRSEAQKRKARIQPAVIAEGSETVIPEKIEVPTQKSPQMAAARTPLYEREESLFADPLVLALLALLFLLLLAGKRRKKDEDVYNRE